MQAGEKTANQKFIARKEFALPIDPLLVKILKQVLGGLTKVTISMKKLKVGLQSSGPAKIEEFRQRFSEYIDSAVQNKDQSRTRIVLE